MVHTSSSKNSSERRIAIVGGGPAGLSIARLLSEKPGIHATVFEADAHVGGKCLTLPAGDRLIEYGTCYAVRAHRVVLDWMKEQNIPMRRFNKQYFDGGPIVPYIVNGDGPNIVTQLLRFMQARRRLMNGMAKPNPSPDILVEAAMPILDWLTANDLGKMERMMYRGMTSLGYGYLHSVSTIQTLNWVDVDLFLSALFRQVWIPKTGWMAFWDQIAAPLDVHRNAAVTRVNRHASGVEITLHDGQTFDFDEVVCAIPMDLFCKTTEPTRSETIVSDGVEWSSYTTTLVAAHNWFTDYDSEAYSYSNGRNAKYGQMLAARYEGDAPELGGPLYLIAQNTGDYTEAELGEILFSDIRRQGGEPVNLIRQKSWSYFPQYKNDAVANGLIQTMSAMQGERRTWYTGSTFSHEAVSNIVNFNVDLVREIIACPPVPAKDTAEPAYQDA